MEKETNLQREINKTESADTFTYNNNQVAELVPPLSQATSEVKDNLAEGKYTLLIGDDTSGRIPTLIMRGVISHVYLKNEMTTLPAHFIQGDKNILSLFAQRRLEKLLYRKNNEDSRALVVTEYIHMGDHIKSIGKVLNSHKIPFDVITCGRAQEIDNYKKSHKINYDSIMYPEDMPIAIEPTIYKKRHLSGYKKFYEGTVIPCLQQDKKSFITARQDVKQAVSQIIFENNL